MVWASALGFENSEFASPRNPNLIPFSFFILYIKCYSLYKDIWKSLKMSQTFNFIPPKKPEKKHNDLIVKSLETLSPIFPSQVGKLMEPITSLFLFFFLLLLLLLSAFSFFLQWVGVLNAAAAGIDDNWKHTYATILARASNSDIGLKQIPLPNWPHLIWVDAIWVFLNVSFSSIEQHFILKSISNSQINTVVFYRETVLINNATICNKKTNINYFFYKWYNW